MLGNDVVDLQLAAQQSNWRRKNYLSKIFGRTEQELVYRATDPDLVVWLMWSMKEAAYKIVNRSTRLRFYDPLAFNCCFQINGGFATGTVNYQDQSFTCFTEINADFVHTIALQQGISPDDVTVIYTLNQPEYLQVFNDNNSLRLTKNMEMLPEIYNPVTQVSHLASLSHHGDQLFIAYSRSLIR